MTWKIGICVVAWMLGCGVARLGAAERRVEVAPGVGAAWVVPEGAWDGRAVVLLHGMASDMDDAGGLFKRTAEALAARGIASLRINFRGEGDAARTDLRSTAHTRREDAWAAFAFVAAQPGADAKRVGALGWSMGCVTAIDAAAERPGTLRSAVLWSCPGGDLGAGFAKDFASAREDALRTGAGTWTFEGWKIVTLRREFFESYEGLVFERRLEKFTGAVLWVRGVDDYLPQREAEWLKIVPGRPAEACLLAGADHIFRVFDPSATQAARAVEVTVAWFERTL